MAFLLQCFKKFPVSIVLVFFVFSCNDDEVGNPVDSAAPKIEVVSPDINATFDSGQDINIEINLTDESEIISYTIKVINSLNQEEVYNKNVFPANSSANESFLLNLEVSESTVFNIEVKATDDYDNVYEDIASSFTVNRKIGGDLSLDFNITYQGNPFELFKNYDYPSGETVYFTRLSMYISDLKLNNAQGTEILKEVDFVNMTTFLENPPANASVYSYLIDNVQAGTYNNLEFNIGLNNELNDSDPFTFPTTHPLGLSSEHWPGWESYVFFKLEGKLDYEADGTFDQDIALHIGGEDTFRNFTTEGAIVIEDQGETKVNFDLDIHKIFVSSTGEIYDIISNPTIHDLDQINEVITLADNLENAISN